MTGAIDTSKIRNVCIIAHIDHGKSTLADRLLEYTNTIDKRLLKQQTLDSMELERERGITIKLKAVIMEYSVAGAAYELNLIDTPGHVDFSYEVSRSLAACEGAVLVVDATQGIQAQTISNVHKALEAGLVIIPVINKIDLANANVAGTVDDLVTTFGFARADILAISAKTGEGVRELLAQVVRKIPSPGVTSPQSTALRALVFDTFYDDYRGVAALVKVADGTLSKDKLRMMATGALLTPEELGIFKPQRQPVESLGGGEVGYVMTGLKDIHAVKVGDTLVLAAGTAKALPGYKDVKPFVFLSIYPIDNNLFGQLRDALGKLALSDASLAFEPESNTALGFGFRCGFLGLLHADIVCQRLEREYNLELVSTVPSVEYRVLLTDGSTLSVRSPASMPERTRISSISEPWVLVSIVSPAKYVGAVIQLCEQRRGVQQKMEYPSPDRVIFAYELPLSELIHNFFDELKSLSSGFASLDYELLDFRPTDAIKLDVLVHGESVDPLSCIVQRSKADYFGRTLLQKLKDVIPRQQFQISLQAVVGGKVIAREDIPALRKNVLAKMSGGHRERKDKLLEAQKKGKQRLKKVGSVEIPQEAFRQMLSV